MKTLMRALSIGQVILGGLILAGGISSFVSFAAKNSHSCPAQPVGKPVNCPSPPIPSLWERLTSFYGPHFYDPHGSGLWAFFLPAAIITLLGLGLILAGLLRAADRRPWLYSLTGLALLALTGWQAMWESYFERNQGNVGPFDMISVQWLGLATGLILTLLGNLLLYSRRRRGLTALPGGPRQQLIGLLILLSAYLFAWSTIPVALLAGVIGPLLQSVVFCLPAVSDHYGQWLGRQSGRAASSRSGPQWKWWLSGGWAILSWVAGLIATGGAPSRLPWYGALGLTVVSLLPLVIVIARSPELDDPATLHTGTEPAGTASGLATADKELSADSHTRQLLATTSYGRAPAVYRIGGLVFSLFMLAVLASSIINSMTNVIVTLS